MIYIPDAEGDRILDFSNVGYKARGTERLPQNVPNSVAVFPVAGDDTANIQAAIDQVANQPVGADGYRGAVLLQAGTYDIHSQLEIRQSGIVLRGEGQDAGGTILHGRNPLTGGGNPNQRPLIRIYGNGNRDYVGSARNMIDKVVPAGARSFRVDSTMNFSVGDTVRIERPSTQSWIDALGMDDPPDGDPPWQPGTMNVRYDRVITRIEGDRIFVDAPLANSFELQYGGGTIRKYAWNGAIENVGIENLRGDTDFDSPVDEDHAWEFIAIGDGQNQNRAQHVWVRDITAAHFGDSAVLANPGSKWVTVENATSINPVSQISGSRRYTYDLSGELGLVTNSRADRGRHDFVNNSTRPPGPNVFHNSVATNAYNDSGPHQRWATGTLFDNITVEGDSINARNRGSLGTTHGWSGANMVVWNSTAESFTIQNPPTAQNWLVGSQGTIVEDTTFGPQPSGYYDSHGEPVSTGGDTSLYQAQMNDSRNIEVFRTLSGSGNWADASQWDQQVAPLDSYQLSIRDYLIGDIDQFSFDGNASVDNVYIDPTWMSEISNLSVLPITGLDDLSGNNNAAFTIQYSPDSGERVVHGYLALGMRQAASGPVEDDSIRLFDTNPEHLFSFADLGWSSKLSTVDTFVGVMDLGMFLEELQEGSINVQISDDTGVDWGIFTATVATPLNAPSKSSVFIERGSTIEVTTELNAVGRLQVGGFDAGTLRVASTGNLPIAGDFHQTSTGALELELAGTAEYGTLEIDDTAVLDGNLQIAFDESYQPTAGDMYQLLSAASLSGTFDDVSLPSLDEGLTWRLGYESSGVALSVLFAADFNADGYVDHDDRLIWQESYGQTQTGHTSGDADRDGDVDGTDYLIWQRQNGLMVSAASSVRIPEPSAGLLVLALAISVLPCTLRRCA